MTPILETDIRAELDRILASKGFAAAGRLSTLLRYVVDKTLAGETDQLKEYSVGVEVFERGEKYDPRLDSIGRCGCPTTAALETTSAASGRRIAFDVSAAILERERTAR